MTIDNPPKISVIMSVYNGEKYIARALLSILAQSFSDFEVILIDDGSTDSTAEIVGRFRDDRLKFIRQENLGLTRTLNKALELSSGEWIARHDADDFSIWNRFATQVNFLDKNPDIKLLGSNCFLQPERHGIVNEVYCCPEKHDEIQDCIPFHNPFVHGSILIHRGNLMEHGGYNEKYRYVQDYELWTRIITKVEARNLRAPLYVRSTHPESTEVKVDKHPIFEEIRGAYLNSAGDIAQLEKEYIYTVPFYPVLSWKNGWTQAVSKTFRGMSQVAGKHGLNWAGYRFQSLFYAPWLF
jgi:glycosyltransferase involved in cell wall biosynthesis